MRESNSTSALCAGRNCLVLIYGSKVTWFCVRAENYLFLVRGSFDLVFVRLVKLTWFLYAGLKSLGYSVNIELDFVFVWVGEIDFKLIVGDQT